MLNKTHEARKHNCLHDSWFLKDPKYSSYIGWFTSTYALYGRKSPPVGIQTYEDNHFQHPAIVKKFNKEMETIK